MNSSRSPSRHTPLRRATAVALLALSGMVAAFAVIRDAPDAILLLPKTALPEPLEIAYGEVVLPAPASFVREERFQRGDTVADLLARLGVIQHDAQRLLRVRALRPGLTVNAEVGADGRLIALRFLAGKDTLVTVQREAGEFKASEEHAPLDARAVLKSGAIRTSLFAAADAVGLPDSVAIQMADVFGGDIDFHRDLRKGDRFAVVYEMNFLDGRAVHSGRVLAAEFVNQGKSFRAVYFTGADGKGGYYAPDGKNLRKAFLRSPLEFSRVSSGFGLRMHPFLQTWRAHQGVDYAAPAGTRVRAVSNGVVEFAGRQGGYGNLVILRHPGQYTTAYAHLSGFARGLRKGRRVAQGDPVGFVGRTGWATGPHLHYEFRVAGKARNPLAVVLPAAQPVAAREMETFSRHARPLVAQLDLLAAGGLALLE